MGNKTGKLLVHTDGGETHDIKFNPKMTAGKLRTELSAKMRARSTTSSTDQLGDLQVQDEVNSAASSPFLTLYRDQDKKRPLHCTDTLGELFHNRNEEMIIYATTDADRGKHGRF